jgi:hypothetical protein
MLATLVPLWIFLLMPVWLPLIGSALGAGVDALRALRGHVPHPSVAERIRLQRQAEPVS